MRKYAKVVVIVLVLLLIATSATISVATDKNDLGNAPEVEWSITYGNNDTNDLSCGIIPTEDGGYILAGYLYGNGESWVMKIDSNGQIVWNKKCDSYPYAFSMTPAIDGGYIIGGCLYGMEAVWLLKIDDNGNEQWNKTYGWEREVVPVQIIKTENGYLIVGMIEDVRTETLLFKVDPNGNLLWDTEFHGNCLSIAGSDDEGYFLVGGDRNFDDAVVIKTDESGNQQWIRNYGQKGFFL